MRDARLTFGRWAALIELDASPGQGWATARALWQSAGAPSRGGGSPARKVARPAILPSDGRADESDSAVRLEEAVLDAGAFAAEQDRLGVERGVVLDDVRRDHLPGVAIEILPHVLADGADAEAGAEDVAVVAARFPRNVEPFLHGFVHDLRAEPALPLGRGLRPLAAVLVRILVGPRQAEIAEGNREP